jgi:hypothetical protein
LQGDADVGRPPHDPQDDEWDPDAVSRACRHRPNSAMWCLIRALGELSVQG